MKNCYTCELVRRRDSGEAPLWDCIYRSLYWDLVHSYNTSLPGWLVLVARRHMDAVDEMSEDEAVELGLLLRRVSMVLKAVCGCEKTYVVQFAEAADHPHVHFHVIPRMPYQLAEHRGPGIFKMLGVPEAERISETEMNILARQVRAYFTDEA